MLKGLLTETLAGLSGRGGPPPSVDGALYVVGDVHGRLDLLEDLAAQILPDAMDAVQKTGGPARIVFVGDVVDRGPDSRGVVEFLMSMRDWPELQAAFVIGNHEIMLLQFLADPVRGRRWLRFGGYETLVSYGLRRLGDIGDHDDLRELADGLRNAMGDHVAFLEAMVASYLVGNVLVTHAGADPDLPVDHQPIKSLTWGCENFERTRRTDGLWVVHGHTIVRQPSARQGRISVDTGAYTTGQLSALRLVGGTLSFLSANGSSGPDDFS